MVVYYKYKKKLPVKWKMWFLANQIYVAFSGAAVIQRVVLHQGDQSFKKKSMPWASIQVTGESMAWPYYAVKNHKKGFIILPVKQK